ncbi:MAG: YfhO family protein [Ruminococcus sp.]|nr:YfhO family protein [Ruminococcus sp.]
MAKNKTKKKNPSAESRKNMTAMDVRKAKRDVGRFEFLSVENEPRMIKKKGFLNNNLYIILAFIVPFLLMYLAFAFHKCQPFGDQQILVTDLWHQYFPFLVDYQDKLKHGESLFWSWTQGGGTNYFSLMSYYLASPLNFLTVLLPSKLFDYNNVAVLNMYLTFTVAVRIGCAGGFFAIFARYVFKRNDISLVIFGTCFALSAFFMGYYWCYIWLDTAALTPLVTMGLVALMRERKYRTYIIALAVSVLSNYYIGLFTCVFMVLCFIGYSIIEFKGFKNLLKNFLRVAICSVVSLMLTTFLMLPAFFGLQNTHAAGSTFPANYALNFPELLTSFTSFWDALLKTLDGLRHVYANTLTFIQPNTVESSGAPNIACGMLALIMALLFFVNRKVKLREKFFCGGLLIFLGLSCVIRQLDYMWHGFHFTNMIPFRFSYLISFVIVVMAFRTFHIIHKTGVLDIILATLLTVGIFLISYDLNPDYDLGTGDNAIKIRIVLYSAILAGIIITLLLLYSTYIINKTVMTIAFAVLIVLQGSVTAYIGVDTTKTTTTYDYPRAGQNTAEVVEYMKEQEKDTPELWRAEFTSTQTLCDTALNGFNGVSMFNSMTNESITKFAENFGLMGWLSGNRYTYAENSPVTNLFMNLKYIIARDGNVNNGAYLSPVTSSGNVKLFKNKSYIPMGFMAESALLDYYGQDAEDTYNPFENQNKFFKLATGVDKNVYERVENPTQSHTAFSQFQVTLPYEGSYGVYNFSTVDSSVTPHLHWNYKAPKSGYYYAYTRITDGENLSVYKNGQLRNGTNNFYIKRPYIMSIGYYKKGDTISIHCELKQNANGNANIYVNYLNEEVFNEGFDRLKESSMTTTKLSGSSMEGTINVKKDGLFYTSVPYESGKTKDDKLIGKLFASDNEGWQAYVDNQKVDITPVANALVAFKLTKGEHKIELKYIPKGFIKGAIISGFALLLFVLYTLFLFLWRKKKLPKKLQNKLPERTEKSYTIL